MKITDNLTEQAVLREIGRRLAQRRLLLGKSQVEFAEECGLGRRTIQHAEAGRSIQTDSLVRMLRSLKLLEALEALLPDQGPSPMDLLRLKTVERKRVVRNRSDRKAPPSGGWQWGDEA